MGPLRFYIFSPSSINDIDDEWLENGRGHQCGRVGLERMVSESDGIYPQLFSP